MGNIYFDLDSNKNPANIRNTKYYLKKQKLYSLMKTVELSQTQSILNLKIDLLFWEFQTN